MIVYRITFTDGKSATVPVDLPISSPWDYFAIEFGADRIASVSARPGLSESIPASTGKQPAASMVEDPLRPKPKATRVTPSKALRQRSTNTATVFVSKTDSCRTWLVVVHRQGEQPRHHHQRHSRKLRRLMRKECVQVLNRRCDKIHQLVAILTRCNCKEEASKPDDELTTNYQCWPAIL